MATVRNQLNGRSNFSVFLMSRSVDVLDLKVVIFVLKNKGNKCEYLNNITH